MYTLPTSSTMNTNLYSSYLADWIGLDCGSPKPDGTGSGSPANGRGLGWIIFMNPFHTQLCVNVRLLCAPCHAAVAALTTV